MPDPEQLLHGLQSLWETPPDKHAVRPFSLAGAYRRAGHSFRHNLGEHNSVRSVLRKATESLDPFVHFWRPSVVVHNEFHDDQMLEISDG